MIIQIVQIPPNIVCFARNSRIDRVGFSLRSVFFPSDLPFRRRFRRRNSSNRNRGPTPIGRKLEAHACYTFYDTHSCSRPVLIMALGNTKNNNIAHVSSYDIFALHHFTTSWEEPRWRETFGYRGAHLRSWDRCASSDAQSGGRGPLNDDPAM